MHKIGEVVVLDGRNFHGTYFGNIVSKEVNFAHFFPSPKAGVQ